MFTFQVRGIYRSRNKLNTAASPKNTPALGTAYRNGETRDQCTLSRQLRGVTSASSQQLNWYSFLQDNLSGLWFLFFLAIYMVCTLCKQYGGWGPLSAALMVYILWRRWKIAPGTMFRVSWMERSKSRCCICTPEVSYLLRRAKRRRNNH